ncbi:hypothetical protein EDWATA_00898 [Edwardsiella tarda ATCC 23685]|uniref:Uncharacterized protein n=1 Tax=Edwardsiella tarda ATCC 23685 TaxID=500638 RepID=D4F2E9_EDWTA|nr:hypothetical protein EDWATA_00898 [Edwardsiella tarda ATCC 23685]
MLHMFSLSVMVNCDPRWPASLPVAHCTLLSPCAQPLSSTG